jgi:hypothetical protein
MRQEELKQANNALKKAEKEKKKNAVADFKMGRVKKPLTRKKTTSNMVGVGRISSPVSSIEGKRGRQIRRGMSTNNAFNYVSGLNDSEKVAMETRGGSSRNVIRGLRVKRGLSGN